MDFRQVEDALIHAERVTIMAKASRLGPKPLRAQKLPYVHSSAEMTGWGQNPGDRRSRDPKANACRLLPEDRFLESRLINELFDVEPELSEEEVQQATDIEGLIHLVEDENHRRALLAWAYAMAGGRPFKRWCKANRITPQTGRRWKKLAVQQIVASFNGKSDLHDTNPEKGVLPITPENGDVSGTLTGNEGHETSINSWAADDAFQPFHVERIEFESGGRLNIIAVDQSEFTWAKRRCQIRAQREAKRRQKQAA